MTLRAFQSALADLVASPARCLAVRADPAAALAGLDLTDRECRRLAAVVWQRGMSANCTVHRATRITPLYTMLPLTCGLLGDTLAIEADAYWAAGHRLEVRFDLEIARFAAALGARLASGATGLPHAEAIADVLAIELASEILKLGIAPKPPAAGAAWRLDPALQFVALRHDPGALVAAAANGIAALAQVPRGVHGVLLSITDGRLELLAVPPALARPLAALAGGRLASVPAALAGLAVAA